MKYRNIHVEPGNIAAKSEAQKLKDRLASDTGKVFRRPDFHPIDPTGLILERNFHETGETVQVHLTRNRKVQAVYLIGSP
jgi:hypothetical protein